MSTAAPAPLLAADRLHIALHTANGSLVAVRQVSFELQRGDTLGLIGESGCGKSLTALALMGLLPDNAQVSGSLRLDGHELLGQSERHWCRIRGRRLAMVFQEPMTALNPVHRIGHQIAEPLRLHQGLSARVARQRAIELLERVGIPEPARRVDAWPHQFSGGQRQRIMIAMALACAPDVLIADEPTTALDVTVQEQILALIRELVVEHGMALILISHDLALVAQNVQRMLVMYGGQVVESGRAADVFAHAAHPYTRGLLAARPQLPRPGHTTRRDVPLPTIAGNVPKLAELPPGCAFAGRCPHATPSCAASPAPRHALSATHAFNCHRAAHVLAQSPHA